MSFRQDRTNPSTAVSNWHGRSETPKGWPSTQVSKWINGGLFSAAVADFEFIAKVGPADGSTNTVSFTSIPQTYRNLRLVMSNARRDSSANAGISIQYNGNTTAGDYGWVVMYALGGAAAKSSGATFPPYGDMPNSSNTAYCIWDIGQYSDSSVGTTT